MEPVAHTPKESNFTDKSRQFAQKFLEFCQQIAKSISKALKNFRIFLKRSWRKFLRRFAKWIDPKLEPYRTHSRNNQQTASTQSQSITSPEDLKVPDFQPVNHEAKPLDKTETLDDTPRTRAELFELLSQAPHSVFNQRERNMMANLLDLPSVKVSEIMLPASKIVYVNIDEILGPLTLDRLYRSGFSHFPVKNAKGELIGCVHTTHFNNLDIRESNRVSEILDPELYFVRDDYSLEQTLNVFLRTNAFFFLVTDRYGKIVGLITFKDFMHYLFGSNPKDAFDRDNDRLAVASRRE